MVGDSCPSGLLIHILHRKIPLGVDGIPSDNDSDDSDGDEDDEDAGVARVRMEFTVENTLYRIRSFGSVVGMPPIVTAVVHWPRNIQGKVEQFGLWRVEQ